MCIPSNKTIQVKPWFLTWWIYFENWNVNNGHNFLARIRKDFHVSHICIRSCLPYKTFWPNDLNHAFSHTFSQNLILAMALFEVTVFEYSQYRYVKGNVSLQRRILVYRTMSLLAFYLDFCQNCEVHIVGIVRTCSISWYTLKLNQKQQ